MAYTKKAMTAKEKAALKAAREALAENESLKRQLQESEEQLKKAKKKSSEVQVVVKSRGNTLDDNVIKQMQLIFRRYVWQKVKFVGNDDDIAAVGKRIMKHNPEPNLMQQPISYKAQWIEDYFKKVAYRGTSPRLARA